MERLTKVMGCSDGTKIYDISNELFKANYSRETKIRILLEKLVDFEDLEELIGISLEELTKIFCQHVPDDCKHPHKAIVLTDDDVDEWNACKEARKKQVPQKPDYEGDGFDFDGNIVYDTWICPNCQKRYEVDYEEYAHCPECGQAINWEKAR